jgi:Secretion system C-terminal sorting domain/Reeler domain
MKKIINIFSFMAIGILLVSNSGGKAAVEGEGMTGAPGDRMQANGSAITCQNCHNNGTYNPTAKIEFFNDAGTAAVTKYEADKTYTIRLTISATGTPPAYGFQMIDIRKTGSTNIKGFLPTTSQATGIQVTAITTGNQANRSYAEHSRRLTSNMINVKWKAPASGTGSVVFYAVGNAANGSGGNGTASINAEFAELTSSVNELATTVEMSVSPNPTSESVVLSLSSKKSKNIHVRMTDISGRTVISEKKTIQEGENTIKLDVSNLVTGVYMIQVVENQDIISKKILKL